MNWHGGGSGCGGASAFAWYHDVVSPFVGSMACFWLVTVRNAFQENIVGKVVRDG